jgi:UDP-N-acetylmuramoyl-tripeptide--D-alanyl-D-alanine ligase
MQTMIEKFEYSLQTILNLFKSDKPDFNISGELKSITTSSEEVREGSLFIPLKGNRDGHQFIKNALDKGANSFLFEKKNEFLSLLSKEELSKGIEVRNTLQALGKLSKFHRNRFLPYIICITGSSGKTTTKEIIGKCVSYLGDENLVITEKNYNNEIGLPFTLFRINKKTKVCVLELGMNHRYEISRMVNLVNPHSVLVTNVGPCHIENLGSIKDIAKAKAEIIEGNNRQNIYIPNDIEYKEIFSDKSKKYKSNIFSFSVLNSKYLKVLDKSSTGFELEIFDKKINWNLPVQKVLDNLVGSIELLVNEGFDKGGIFEGLEKYKSSNKRNVLIDKSIKIIDDTYNANPDSMVSSIDSLIQIAGENKTYAILGDMKELGNFSKRYHKEIGNYCSKRNISGLFTFGTDSIHIYTEYNKNYKNSYHFENSEENINELIKKVISIVTKGSVLLVKGSRSMKMERIVEALEKSID